MSRFAMLRATTLALSAALLVLSNPVPAQEAQQMTPQQEQMLKELKKTFRKNFGRDPSPEEQQQFMASANRMQIQMMGAIAGLSSGRFSPNPQQAQSQPMPAPVRDTVPPAATPQATSGSAGNALRVLMASAKADGSFAVFERGNDGFRVNGQPYIDPDGKVLDFGADAATGLVTYLVDGGEGTSLVKLHNAKSNGNPVLAGRLRTSGNRSIFEGVDGQSAGGDSIVPMGRG